MDVIVKEALANGRLTPRVRNATLERAANAVGATVDAVALAAVLAQPFVDIVLSGVSTRDALASNLAAAALRLPDATLAELEALEEDSADYWSTRSALPWN
jgi:aryl-alcohol dehydrogenase-like predicted oxidoreductase